MSLNYERFIPSGYKDIGIRKFEFVAKTKLLNVPKRQKIQSLQRIICTCKLRLGKRELRVGMNSSGLVPSTDPVYNSCTAFSTSTLPISGRRTDQQSSSRSLSSKLNIEFFWLKSNHH